MKKRPARQFAPGMGGILALFLFANGCRTTDDGSPLNGSAGVTAPETGREVQSLEIASSGEAMKKILPPEKMPGSDAEAAGHVPFAGIWTLELDSLHGAEKSWEKPVKNITISYDPSTRQIAGCSGVNRYFGPAVVDEANGIFRPGSIGATRMSGPGMEYEDLFLHELAKADSFSIENGKLLLKSGNRIIAVFAAKGKVSGSF